MPNLRHAPKHARRRRIRPAARVALRSVAIVVLAGVAIMAVVGGPGGSASADDEGTRSRVVQQDDARALPMVGPATTGIVELLSTLDTGPAWDEGATPVG